MHEETHIINYLIQWGLVRKKPEEISEFSIEKVFIVFFKKFYNLFLLLITLVVRPKELKGLANHVSISNLNVNKK